jgi:glutathione S-transferase
VRELYQFVFSHYCEKARWALDHKRLRYQQRNLLPGAHRKVAQALAPRSCLPILVDDGTVVQDSASIVSFLDQKYPEHPLTPADPDEARQAIEWEQFLDREIGLTLRLWFYYHTLPDRGRSLRFLLSAIPWHRRVPFVIAYPKVRVAMSRAMGIEDESARYCTSRLLAALARLDAALQDRSFLVGEKFSRADLAACALLSPYCRAGESHDEASSVLAEPVSAMRAEHRTRRYFEWVAEIYGKYRKPMH